MARGCSKSLPALSIPGETIEAVARREALEEAGLELQQLHHIQNYLVSPGGTTERVSLFVGRADSTTAGGIFGLPEEAEDIRVRGLCQTNANQVEIANLGGR